MISVEKVKEKLYNEIDNKISSKKYKNKQIIKEKVQDILNDFDEIVIGEIFFVDDCMNVEENLYEYDITLRVDFYIKGYENMESTEKSFSFNGAGHSNDNPLNYDEVKKLFGKVSQ